MNILSLAEWKKFFLTPKRKALTLFALGLAITTGVVAGIATSKTDEVPNTSTTKDNSLLIVETMKSIQDRVASLEKEVKKPAQKVDLSAITTQIKELTNRIENQKSGDFKALHQSLSETITETQSTLGSKLESIKEVINQMNTKQEPIKYLKPESLPFKIVSIDSIQHIPVASIAYDFKTIPLEKGEKLAGWKVLNLDYGRQQLVLENSNKERVLITSSQIG